MIRKCAETVAKKSWLTPLTKYALKIIENYLPSIISISNLNLALLTKEATIGSSSFEEDNIAIG